MWHVFPYLLDWLWSPQLPPRPRRSEIRYCVLACIYFNISLSRGDRVLVQRKKWDIIIFQGWVNRESRNIRWKINLSKMITQASFQREFLLSFLLWNSLLTFHKIIHLQSFCCWSSQLSLSRKINFPIAGCCCPAAGLTICRPTWLGAQLLYQSEESFSNCLDLNSWRSCS